MVRWVTLVLEYGARASRCEKRTETTYIRSLVICCQVQDLSGWDRQGQAKGSEGREEREAAGSPKLLL